MTKFNSSVRGSNKIINHEGEEAYSLSNEMELYTAVVTSILSDIYYEKENDRLSRIRELVKNNKPEFVAQIAIYARTQMYLRTLPIILLVELAKIHNGDSLIRRLTNKIVLRVDELTEVLAYYAIANERKGIKKLGKLSNQLKAGLRDRMSAFDEYQFAKYNRDGLVKLKDVLFLTHPKNKEKQELFNKIKDDSLEVPYTWETVLAKVGQVEYKDEEEKQKAFTKAWEELIDSKKLGYMALMRNLRNILEAKVSVEHIEKVSKYLSNKDAVIKSKQFPFRFLSAYYQIQNVSSADTSILLEALEKAVIISAENIKGFDSNTKVFISSDFSGSMESNLSKHSKIEYKDIGIVLSMLLQNKCSRVITSIFGSNFKVKNFPKNNILLNSTQLSKMRNEVGHSTNAYLALDHLIETKEIVDKVMLFSDMQLWRDSNRWNYSNNSFKESWLNYKKIAPNAKLYLFDLSGYGNSPLSIEGDVRMIGGWSDKVFDMLEAYENGSSALKEIKKIEV